MRNEKLIAAREDRGWSQAVAAEKIRVSRVAYARWEEQGLIPRLWAINRAREEFNMSAEQLGFKKYPTSVSASKSLTLAPSKDSAGVTDAGATPVILKVVVSALVIAQHMYGCTLEELLSRADQELRRLDAMTQQHPEQNTSRREALKFLVGLPAVVMGLSAVESTTSFSTEEALSLYMTAVPASCKLYFDGGLVEVADILPQHISQLTRLVQQSSRYQEMGAGLLSQAHQLGYLLDLQDQNFKAAQTHVQQALHFAEIANDSNLRVASLIRQGNLFFTLKRPSQSLQKYQEAVQYSSTASPLLQGQAHIGLAEAYAQFSNQSSSLKEAALRHHGLAREVFPASPEQDAQYAYTHFNSFTLTNFEGLMHLHLGQPQQAWDAFADVDKLIPTALVPQRVELINRQAATLLALGDLDAACDRLELAVPSALKLGSDLRYNETCEIYQQMQEMWPGEQRVKALAELFQQG